MEVPLFPYQDSDRCYQKETCDYWHDMTKVSWWFCQLWLQMNSHVQCTCNYFCQIGIPFQSAVLFLYLRLALIADLLPDHVPVASAFCMGVRIQTIDISTFNSVLLKCWLEYVTLFHLCMLYECILIKYRAT